jgi:hypothetical protein
LSDPDQVVFSLSAVMAHLLVGTVDNEALAAQAKPGF